MYFLKHAYEVELWRNGGNIQCMFYVHIPPFKLFVCGKRIFSPDHFRLDQNFFLLYIWPEGWLICWCIETIGREKEFCCRKIIGHISYGKSYCCTKVLTDNPWSKKTLFQPFFWKKCTKSSGENGLKPKCPPQHLHCVSISLDHNPKATKTFT